MTQRAPTQRQFDDSNIQQQNASRSSNIKDFRRKMFGAPSVPPSRGGGGRVAPPPTPPTGGGGGKKAPPPGPPSQTDALSNKIRDKAVALMDGKDGRFTPERVQGMKDQLFESTIGRVKREVRSMDAGLVRRGMFRSGISARAESDIRRDAMTNYSRGVKEILLKKLDAEFEDKMKGMQMAQTWLTQKQNYDLGKERNQIARDQIAASMANARLSAQVSREGIAAANARARASLAQQQSQFELSFSASQTARTPDFA